MSSETHSFPLPGFNIDPNLITAAGFSLGAWEAHHLHVLDSATFKGAGLLNGYLFNKTFNHRNQYKLKGDETEERLKEMSKDNAEAAKGYLKTIDEYGWADSISNIKDSPVYIYSGS